MYTVICKAYVDCAKNANWPISLPAIPNIGDKVSSDGGIVMQVSSRCFTHKAVILELVPPNNESIATFNARH